MKKFTIIITLLSLLTATTFIFTSCNSNEHEPVNTNPESDATSCGLNDCDCDCNYEEDCDCDYNDGATSYDEDETESAGGITSDDLTAEIASSNVAVSGNNQGSVTGGGNVGNQTPRPPANNPPQNNSPTPTSRAPVVTPPPASAAPAQTVDTSNFEAEVLRLINVQRQAVGSLPLQLYGRLAEIARAHSREMASVDQLGHDGLDGSLPWERIARANLSIHPRSNSLALGSSAGNENAGAGQNSPERIVELWMNSPGHRANMLDRRWTHAGVGFVRTDTGNFRNFWTIKFVRQHAPFQPPSDCHGKADIEGAVCYMPGWGMCPPCWRAYRVLD